MSYRNRCAVRRHRARWRQARRERTLPYRWTVARGFVEWWRP